MSQLPDLRAYKQGRDILPTFQNDVGTALHKVKLESYDDEAMHLANAANIVRRDMMTMKSSFNGSFSETCQLDFIPKFTTFFGKHDFFWLKYQAAHGSTHISSVMSIYFSVFTIQQLRTSS